MLWPLKMESVSLKFTAVVEEMEIGDVRIRVRKHSGKPLSLPDSRVYLSARLPAPRS